MWYLKFPIFCAYLRKLKNFLIKIYHFKDATKFKENFIIEHLKTFFNHKFSSDYVKQ